MTMKLYASKTKAIVALVLVLCIAMSFISPVASAYVLTTHTHSCHEKEHKENCYGTIECCKICRNIDRVKSQSLYCSDVSKLSVTSTPDLSLLTVNYEFENIFSANLISLKVRLNN